MSDKTIAELLQQAGELAQQGRIDEALALTRQAETLRKRAQKAEKKAAETTKEGDGGERGASARKVVISALAEIGVPVSPRAVAEYARLRFGTDVAPGTFASLRRDELRAFKRNTVRPVFVVPALDGRRFLAIRGKVALSDWRLEQRLLGPWSERVDHLRATLNVARQFVWLTGAHPAAASRFADLVATYAATIPGALEPGAQPDPEQIERAAQAELAALETKDNQWREEAADRARAQLGGDTEKLLWGCEPIGIVRDANA